MAATQANSEDRTEDRAMVAELLRSPQQAQSAEGGWRRRLGRLALLALIGAVLAVGITMAIDRFVMHNGGAGIDQQALSGGSGTRTVAAALGFDLSETTVPAGEIRHGGPPKDGIPALTNPQFIAAHEATYLAPEDRVVGYVAGEDARAYPLRILNYHEVVNDQVAGVPIAVTYCPLCDSAAVFDRRTPLGVREFGVSGLLYNSNVLMYDRGAPTESLWSQVKAEGISGPAGRQPLEALPMELTTWGDWSRRHPNTKVLSLETGHQRNYQRNPYGGYFQRPQLMFPVEPRSDRLPTKARVLGVWTDSAAKAYPVAAFGDQRRTIEDRVGGKRVVIETIPEAQTLRVIQAEEGVDWMYSLWFAWYAFRPETEVFQ